MATEAGTAHPPLPYPPGFQGFLVHDPNDLAIPPLPRLPAARAVL